MQQIKERAKKVRQKLQRGDIKKIAERLEIPYTNVTTAFEGRASIELTQVVILQALKLQKQRKSQLKRFLKKAK